MKALRSLPRVSYKASTILHVRDRSLPSFPSDPLSPKTSHFQSPSQSQVSLRPSHCTCVALSACNDNSRIVLHRLSVFPDCSASRRSVVTLPTYNRDRLQTQALRIRPPRVLHGGVDHLIIIQGCSNWVPVAILSVL